MKPNSKRWLRNLKRRENKILELCRAGRFIEAGKIASSKFFPLVNFYLMAEWRNKPVAAKPVTTFDEAIKVLEIEEYRERICNSNSHGELSHLADYIHQAQGIRNISEVLFFKAAFVSIVQWCEKNWTRPESCFQHMPKLFGQLAEQL